MGRNVVGTLLGGWLVLASWAPAGAQDAKPAEVPGAAVAVPDADAGPETLRDLEARREKARVEVQLMEAQLAVKRAEAQKVEAEVRVFLIQHPELLDQETLMAAIRSDPEVAALRAQIEQARAKEDSVRRMARSVKDPSVTNASNRLRSLEERLQEHVKGRRYTLLDVRGPGQPDEVVRRLDAIIGELEGAKRALLRESPGR